MAQNITPDIFFQNRSFKIICMSRLQKSRQTCTSSQVINFNTQLRIVITGIDET